MKTIGDIINSIIIGVAVFGFFGYGLLLMLGLPFAWYYRHLTLLDFKLYYEGLCYLLVAACMFKAATQPPDEELSKYDGPIVVSD